MYIIYIYIHMYIMLLYAHQLLERRSLLFSILRSRSTGSLEKVSSLLLSSLRARGTGSLKEAACSSQAFGLVGPGSLRRDKSKHRLDAGHSRLEVPGRRPTAGKLRGGKNQ